MAWGETRSETHMCRHTHMHSLCSNLILINWIFHFQQRSFLCQLLGTSWYFLFFISECTAVFPVTSGSCGWSFAPVPPHYFISEPIVPAAEFAQSLKTHLKISFHVFLLRCRRACGAASAVELKDVLHSPHAALGWKLWQRQRFLLGLTLLPLINICVINLLWHKASPHPPNHPPTHPTSQTVRFKPQSGIRSPSSKHRQQYTIKPPSCGFAVSVLSVCCLLFFYWHIWGLFSPLGVLMIRSLTTTRCGADDDGWWIDGALWLCD